MWSLLGVKGVMWSLLGVNGVGSVVTHHTSQRRITPTPQMPVQTNTSQLLLQRIHTRDAPNTLPTARRVDRKHRLFALLAQNKQTLLDHTLQHTSYLNRGRCALQANRGMDRQLSIRCNPMSEDLLIRSAGSGFQRRKWMILIRKEQSTLDVISLSLIHNLSPCLSLLPLAILAWQWTAHLHPHRIFLRGSFKHEVLQGQEERLLGLSIFAWLRPNEVFAVNGSVVRLHNAFDHGVVSTIEIINNRHSETSI